MDPLFELSIEATRWLQQNYPWLEGLMQLFAVLGAFNFYLALLPLIYWSVHKPFGRRLLYLIAFSNLFTEGLKSIFRGPRPLWLATEVGLGEEISYGVPSGHSLIAVVAYFYAASWIRRRWAWVLAIVLSILMAISRVYLGVHFVHDVVLGYVLGVLIFSGSMLWARYGQPRYVRRIMGQRLLIVTIVPLVLAALYAIVKFVVGPADLTVAWALNVEVAEIEGLDNVVAGTGALLGIGIGLVLESGWVRFRVDGSVKRRIARYVVGMVGVALLFFGLRSVFPNEPPIVSLPLRFARYFLTGLWGAYYAPMLFVRIGLADADPDPGIQVGLRRDFKRDADQE